MKKSLLALGVISLALMLSASCLQAEDQPAAGTTLKQEISGDRQKIGEMKQQIKTNAQQARQGEKDLRGQIKTAVQSGDKATADQLRQQLGATHQANVQQKQQDRKAIQEAKKDLRQDLKTARATRAQKAKGPKK